MKRIIGYTDSVQECDCCGKTELKGTYCLEIDGVELYYGSVCAFKIHGISEEDRKEALTAFKKAEKNKKLIEIHIEPIKAQLQKRIEDSFTVKYEELTPLAKKIHSQIIDTYTERMQRVAKKYKIEL